MLIDSAALNNGARLAAERRGKIRDMNWLMNLSSSLSLPGTDGRYCAAAAAP